MSLLRMEAMTNESLILQAKRIRKKIVQALHASGGGHYGGALSVTDILVSLYAHCHDSEWFWEKEKRQKIILSKGHAAIALYCILADYGRIDEAQLSQYGKLGSLLQGHPDMTKVKEVDFSTGSLGQGLSAGAGMAMILQQCNKNVWVVLGDGECQEGQVWETAMLASRYQLGNLIAIVDKNNAQEFGFHTHQWIEQCPVPDMCKKWSAFGWLVQEVPGHDIPLLSNSLKRFEKDEGVPKVIIAETKKGAGISLFEENPERYHCTELNDKEFELAIKELS